jgi:hypothetical protein
MQRAESKVTRDRHDSRRVIRPERGWSELTGVTMLKMLVPESLIQRPSLGDVFMALFSGSWESIY